MIFIKDLRCSRIHSIIHVNTFPFHDSIAPSLSTKFQRYHQITFDISLMNVYYPSESSLFDGVITEFVFYDQIFNERQLKGNNIR